MKKIICFLLLFTLCLSLCACAISQEKLYGTWNASYIDHGVARSVWFAIDREGNYAQIIFSDGDKGNTKFGKIEIDGRNVRFYPDENPDEVMEFKYRNAALVCDDYKLTRYK